MTGIIEVTGLTKTHGRTTALDGLDLSRSSWADRPPSDAATSRRPRRPTCMLRVRSRVTDEGGGALDARPATFSSPRSRVLPWPFSECRGQESWWRQRVVPRHGPV
jgi:hypothetical protein